MELAEQSVLAWLDKMPMRLTRLRVNIARALLQEKQPPTAELLYRRLDEWGEGTSLGSIYRILKQWEEGGLIQREWQVSPLGNKAVYLLKGDPQLRRAYTLLCTACGRKHAIADLALAQQLVQASQLEGYRLPAEIVIPAQCAACAADTPTASPDGPKSAPAKAG